MFRPNMITLLGLLSVISAIIIVLGFWIVTDNVPAFLYVYTAGCIFVYQSLDAIDGKQARRTHSGGPLGELFDHGCDAISMVLQSVILPILFRVHSPILSITFCAATLMAFYGTTWEEYHTGTLFLGYISGPVDGQIMSIFLLLTGAVFGDGFWEMKIINFKNFDLSLNVAIIGFVILSAMLTVIASIRNVYMAKGVKPSLQLVPFCLFLVSLGYEFYRRPAGHAKIEALLYLGAVGLAFTTSVLRILLAHLCRLDFPQWIHGSTPLVCLILVRIAVIDLKLVESIPTDILGIPSLAICLLINLTIYSRLVYRTIRQFCKFLNISCFRLVKDGHKTK